MKTLIAILGLSAVTAFAQPIDYRFDQVKRTVTLNTGTQELNVAAGTHAESGAKVTTGWFSYALIATEQYRAKFEIFSSTQVQLAQGEPGVLLAVDRGRVRALFDKITGSEPRVVKTPGAMLAVRGTQFDVEVDSAGKTTVDVFEGIVEVRSDLLREPLLVHPGEQSVFARREPPRVRPMPEDHHRNDPTRQPRDGGPQRGMPPHGDGQHQPPPQGTQPPKPPTPPPGGHH